MCSFLDVSSREHFIDPACSVKCRCNSSRKELVNQSWSNQIYFQPNFLYSKGTCFFTSLFYSDSLWDPQPCILASVRAHTSQPNKPKPWLLHTHVTLIFPPKVNHYFYYLMHVQIEVWLCSVSDFSPTRDFVVPAEPNGKMLLVHSQRKPKRCSRWDPSR